MSQGQWQLMWKQCAETCVIHKQLLDSTLQNSLCKDQAVTWPKIGTTYVLICQEQFFYARLHNHLCGQPAFKALPTWSGLISHHLSGYLPSSPTSLLSTPGNTVHSPTSGHLHCSLLVQCSSSPHPPFSA